MDEENQGGLSAAVPVEPPPVPAKPPVFGDLDELAKARAAVTAQQQRLLADLEERSKPQPSDFWAALARGFSNTDSKLFSQGMGAAAGELQKQNAFQSQKEMQVGQMRLEVAQNMLKQQTNNQMLKDLMGGGADAGAGAGGAASAIQNMSPTQKSVFDALSPQDKRIVIMRIMAGDDKVFGQLTEQAIKGTNVPDAVKTLEAQIGALPQEIQMDARRAAAMSAAYGKPEDAANAILAIGRALRNGEIQPPQAEAILQKFMGRFASQGNAPSVAPAKVLQLYAPDENTAAKMGLQLDAQGVPFKINVGEPPKAKQEASDLSPAQKAELEVARQKEEMARESKTQATREIPFEDKYKALAAYDSNTVNKNNRNLKELSQLVKDNPNVVGLLVHKGPLYAILQAAESGAQTPMGSLAMPVTKSLEKLNLSPAEQNVARRISEIMSNLNMKIMQENKGNFGPQISTFDAQKMLEPGFSTTDAAQFITYLAAKHTVTNKYLGDMHTAMSDYFEQNPKATIQSFFVSKPYKNIVNQLDVTYNDLVTRSKFK